MWQQRRVPLAEMEVKGCTSLTDDDIDILKGVHNALDLRVERINQNVGRIYLADRGGNKQRLPTGPQGPVLTMTDGGGAAVAPYNEEFLYVHGDSFTVSVNGQPVLRLDMQRQHSLRAPRHIVHDKLQPTSVN